jgi:hypothetical protein
MATPPRTSAAARLNFILIDEKAQKSITSYLEQCQMLGYQNWNIRHVMRKADLEYARETDYTEENQKAKLANRNGNTNKFQNITVPVVLPAVEAAVTYQSSVFLTGIPLFGVVSSPDHMDQSKQLETLIDHQAIKGGWTRHLMMGFRDSFKYNFCAIECVWERRMLPDFTTSVSASSNSVEVGKIAWEGNVVRRLDPYNTFWDIRYNVTEVSERGEFAGYNELISRVELKQLIQSIPFVIRNNIKPALESASVGISLGSDFSALTYYVPQISQFQTINPGIAGQFNWMAWAGMEKNGNSKEIAYRNIYQKTVLYARLIPSDFGISVPSPNLPQIWKFIIINNKVVIYAQPCSLAYDYLPVLFAQPNEDGLKYQTKSLAANSSDFQSVASAMMNSVIHSRRRAVSDRVLYDPSRITEAQINSDNPSAKIPIRPAAYGKPVSDAVYQFPYRDDQSSLVLQEIGQIVEMSNQLNGQNRAKQGQFVKGNKTRKEFDSVMSNANGRDQMIAMLFEAQLFTPLKEMLKINILQFQTPATVYSRELKSAITIDPVELRQAAMEFKVSDGLIPAEKLIGGDSLGAALNAIGTTPAIAGAYNMGPLFSYLMKTQGADLSPFEKSPQQQAYEQAFSQWQQAVANIVQQLIKAGQPIDPKSFPPQPTPDQFKYTPGMEPPEPEGNIMTQYSINEKAETAGAAGAI